MQNIDGKYIWVIGASSGIGAALAKELALRGAHVIISARRTEMLTSLLTELAGEGHRAVPLDIADAQSVAQAYAQIMRHYPRLDSALFMAVSYDVHDGRQRLLSQIHDMLQVNIGGAFNMIDAIVPHYKQQGHGQIVLCASVAGYRGLPAGQPYCASKAALINLGESLKIDLEPDNIDVKIICPGFVRTPLTDKNGFAMPMIIEAETAAVEIADGLCKRGFEIHFPRRFSLIMKCIRLLPYGLYFMLSRRLRKAAFG